MSKKKKKRNKGKNKSNSKKRCSNVRVSTKPNSQNKNNFNEKKELEKTNEENKDLLTAIKDSLGDKVVDVKVSSRLKSHPVCLVSSDGVSFEMEKVLNQMPDAQGVKAGRILEINPNHDIY